MMPKKWLCFEAELGGELVRFVGKLDYPFHKALEAEKGRGFARFECLMRQGDSGWEPYPRDVEGVSGQSAVLRERIVAFYPLREVSEHWESVWRGLTGT